MATLSTVAKALIWFVLDKIRCDMKPSTSRDDGSNDCHLAVTPNERPIAVDVEYRGRRQEVVDHQMPKVSPVPAMQTSAASTVQPCSSTTADNVGTVPTTPSPSAMMAKRL